MKGYLSATGFLILLAINAAAAAAWTFRLGHGDVIAAGAPFTIEVKHSESQCLEPGGCEWKFYRVFLNASPLPRGTDDDGGNLQTYCYLSGCVATNVTTFSATVPVTSFPNGGPYDLSIGVFNRKPDGSFESPPFSITTHSSEFSLTGASGEWSNFARRNGNFGVRQHLPFVPCEAVPCVSRCQAHWMDVHASEQRVIDSELRECLGSCMANAPPADTCIVKNATTTAREHVSTPTKAAAPSPITSEYSLPSALRDPSTVAGKSQGPLNSTTAWITITTAGVLVFALLLR